MIDNTQFYGINKGAATVDPLNGAIPYLRQAIEQDKNKKAKEDAEVQAQLQKLDFTKTREADQGHLLDQYTEIRNLYTQARQSKDPLVKTKLQNELLGKQAAMQQSIGLSQQAMEKEKQLGALQLNPSANLVDTYAKNYTDLTGTSIFSKDYKTKAEALANPFQPKVDIVTTNKKLLDNSLLDVDNGETIKRLSNGDKAHYTNQGKELKPDKILTNVVAEMHGNPQFRRLVMSAADGVTDPAIAAKNYADNLYNQNKAGYGVTQKHTFNETFDKFYAHKKWEWGNKPGEGNQPTQRQDVIEAMRTSVPGSGEFVSEIVAKNPAYRGHYLAVEKDPKNPSIQTITVPPKQKYDTKTGEWIIEKPQYKVTLDASDPDKYQAGANELLNDITGEKITPTKAFTIAGKGKVPGGLVNPVIGKKKQAVNKNPLGLDL